MAIPATVIWAYAVFGLVLATGLVTIAVRGDWQKATGLDKLLLFGPLFYAAPIGGFGSEHFTLNAGIASIVPAWIPWHRFWAYFVGACFIAAALSIVTGIQARLSASLLALTFFLFVVLMDLPGWARNPRDRFALALALRELSFSAGGLALASVLSGRRSLATIARIAIAIAVLFYSFEQFLHGDYVPVIPLKLATPASIFGHAVWTYLFAVVSGIAGLLLLAGRKTREAATALGLAVLFAELVVYVPIAVMERTSIRGFNFMADTLMFGGAVLLLAGAVSPQPERRP